MSLISELRASLSAHSGAHIIDAKGVSSFADILEESDRKAAALKTSGVRRDSRLLIQTANYSGYVSTLLAALQVGSFPILADPSLGAQEVSTLVQQCGIDHAVMHSSGPSFVALDEMAFHGATEFAGQRPALAPSSILGRLTSGSTRSPACIEYSDTAILNAARGWIAASGLSSADSSLCCAGLHNGLAFNTTLIPGLLQGSDLIFGPSVPTAGSVLRSIAANSPTILVAFPVIYEQIKEYGDRLSPHALSALRRLRLALSSAAPIDGDVANYMRNTGVPIADYYGIAETGPVTYNDGLVPGSQGLPLPTVEITTVSDPAGDHVLAIHTRSMGTKYLNYPGRFEGSLTEKGAYVTSDTGTLNAGHLILGRRTGATLNIGGRKFSAESIRAPLLNYPSIRDCHVVQLSTPTGRDCVGALLETDEVLDLNAVREHIRSEVAAFKVPEVLATAEALPRSSSGKVKSSAVRDHLLSTFTSRA